MIEFAQIDLGSGGSLSCVRCAPSPERTLYDASDVMTRLREAVEGAGGPSATNVVFGGIEPFAHPSLPLLIDSAVSLGCERIRLRTDGGALAGGGNAEGCIHAGVRQIEIVILGAGVEHDASAGREGLFERAVAGAAAFRDAASRAGVVAVVTAVVPVCRHNRSTLPATVAACASLGAVSVAVEPAAGVVIDASVSAETRTAAAMNRIAVHGGGVLPDRYAPSATRGRS